ncbi:hypothetical protein ABT390_08570 [Streptomyces aurantiacus]|uniref:Uncharacterized protein n=1 Tax=Streptomyces aurantiacus JA 4570 TaxID=1286094 RepID=S3ZR79_9ACTN|nr:hypothetical protein [Streptomyces aurantiacus]EPH40905.1 hypothetical protein STRAU_6028 [Streptomyces aurantiacus JA 4570]
MSDWTPGREPEPTEAEYEIPAEADADVPVAPDVPPAPEADVDPSEPAPLEVVRTPTGDAEVDARLDRLADADHLATDGHIEVYEDVHQGLRDALTALDARPGPPAPAGAPHPSYDRS